METQGQCFVRFHATAGERMVCDDKNQTVLVINGMEYGPDSFDMPTLAVGDAIEIRVPTGVLSFTVAPPATKRNSVIGPFRWSGAFNALRGGQSGVGTWHINCMADITTSAWHEPVPYQVYERAHAVADAVYGPAGVKLRRPLLKQSIQFVLEADALLAA